MLASANADTLDIPYLSMARGGSIRTVPTKGGGAGGAERPTVAVYRTTLVPEGASATAAPTMGRTVAGRVFDRRPTTQPRRTRMARRRVRTHS